MNSEAMFRRSLAVVFILLTLIRVYYARKAGKAGEKTSADGEDRFDAVLLRGFNSLAAVAALMYLIAPRWMRWSALPLPAWLRWIGMVAGLVTIALFLWVHRALGENWSTSVEPKGQHALVTSGPYRWARHPMYTALLLALPALPLLLRSLWGLALSLLLVVPALWLRIREEEVMLLAEFGDEYRKYMARTWRLVPFVY